MKTKSVFFCSNCGAESPKWVGKCPACGEWNTFVEETVAAKPKKSQGYLPEGGKTHSITPVKISEVKSGEEQRIALPSRELNRVLDCDSLLIDIPFNSTLDILVENLGRINYGARIVENHKGITQPITIGGSRISGNWNMYGLPLSQMPDVDALPEGYNMGRPVYYRAKFTLDKVGDTFLDMEKWGKGIVFVNGHNLGRYWKVGPQQTLYLPGCWLKEGENEVVVFEQLNDHRKYSLSSVTEPVLDKLQTEAAESETADEVIARLLQENAALREQITALREQMEEMKARGKRGKK